ncbi:MAG: 30S ribosomal protein S6 [SAR324 cluster bacterium]|jgi:small subunit ribosomal protein S6|nr:30S ribosomal protein S6 [SAR324 cluster bacterium]MDP6743329.1 30S ribosomal protein S6 [SAR324 cluster bacterium]MEC8939696.1 30S ribosomal protein S6 [SAR324 cluster bacterium]MEC8980490.1 30S ribosomal protein S6 [SAR324 cluster bacterium]MED5482750.1 30S ribosomal protein S6 [SAR324 cluster bacterium]
MTGYELVFITTPTLSEDDLAVVLKKFKKNLTGYGGKLIHEYVWGRRRLAYEIAGNDFGVYHVWYFTGSGKTVDELQRQFGYSDDVLRNQIVKTDDLDAEAAFLHNLIPPKEEIAEKEPVQEKPAENATDVAEKVETKTEAETVPEKNEAETVEKVEIESEDKTDELADDTGKDKTEAVDA